MRREAMEISDLLRNLDPGDQRYREQSKQLRVLELQLRQAGLSTEFLQGRYGDVIRNRLLKEE